MYENHGSRRPSWFEGIRCERTLTSQIPGNLEESQRVVWIKCICGKRDIGCIDDWIGTMCMTPMLQEVHRRLLGDCLKIHSRSS